MSTKPSFVPETIRTLVPAIDRPYQSGLVFERVFTPRQCERMLEAGLALEIEDGMVGSSEDEYGTEGAIRQARIAWLPAAGDNVWILDKLARVIDRANRMYGFDLIGFTESLQFTCYDRRGSFYDWHQDGLEGELAGRKLSMVVQLSDPATYRGSNLEVFAIEQDYPPEMKAEWERGARGHGSVIVFPAFEYHRVTPLESGKRYSLVSWVGGPPFR